MSADASSFGLGSVLLQRQLRGELRPVAYASRSMTDTERRYAQIEKEALATTWALEHWADLLIGMHFRVETDHLPLVPLLSTKLLDELPIRIQRFRMRLMRYSFSIAHVPGKYLYTADALSRAPLRVTIDRGSEEFQREMNFYVNAVLVQLPASHRRLEEIRREVAKDDTLAIVSRYVKTGWPDDKRKVHGPVNLCWPERGNLSIHDMGCCFGVHDWLCHPVCGATYYATSMIAIRVSRRHARTQHIRCGGQEYLETSRKWSAIVSPVRRTDESASNQ